jgi:outer membrane receptor protein involved in Fe transport
MKQIVFLLTISFSLQAAAQFPGATGGNRGGSAQNMNMGRIYGKIIDAKTGKAMEAVSIQVIQNKFDTISKTRKETVIAGQLTQNNGDFNLEGLPIGAQLKVKITAIGFKPVEQKLQFTMNMNGARSGDISSMMSGFDKDLGNIKMEVDVKQLETATVVGQRALLQLGIDRKTFNVEKNIVSAGGTAVDVMRNVPSVQVDVDGNVTLRNNSPQIFVDGRPSPISLDQIPADAIASVELITNPSAKFDASGGTSGIINIVLKKNRKIGYNGSIRTNIDSRARVGLGGDINVRQNKVNLFASANYGQRRSLSQGQSDRLNFFENPQSKIIQRNDNKSDGRFMFFRAGMDYFADNRNTFSISTNLVDGKFLPFEVIDIYQSTFGSVNSAISSYRTTTGSNQFKNKGVTVSYKHLFTKPGHEMTADVTLNKSRNKNNADFENAPYNVPAGMALQQQVRASGTRQNITAQTDYTYPIDENRKIEAGLRYNQSDVTSLNDNFFKAPGSSSFVYLPALGYNYESVERVGAAYTTYGQKINKTSIQAGLRFESSKFTGNVLDRQQKFSNSFPSSLFPSLFITQNLGAGQDIQLNYTRKINRPNFFQLLPFVDYADSLNISRGNPSLIPEFTNSVELSYQTPYAKNSILLVSAYYKKTEGLITRFQEKEALGGRDVIVSTFINANSSQVYGLELTNKNNLTDWWDVAVNVNFFGSQLQIPNQPVIDGGISWFTKINSNMKLPNNFTVQLSGDYTSRTVLPPGGSGGGSVFGGGGGGGMFGGGGRGGGGMFGQVTVAAQGFIKPFWSMDIAIRKEFLKDRKASLSLNVNDIFRTRRSFIRSESNLFSQDVWRLRDPQVFRLNFSYRFGKFDVSIFKRKNMKGEGEGMRGGMEMGGQ